MHLIRDQGTCPSVGIKNASIAKAGWPRYDAASEKADGSARRCVDSSGSGGRGRVQLLISTPGPRGRSKIAISIALGQLGLSKKSACRTEASWALEDRGTYHTEVIQAIETLIFRAEATLTY